MKFIELCAGAGGTRAGLEKAGWECRFAVDIDPAAVEVHKIAFGDNIICADVSDLNPDDLPQFDALVAGFPCQPYSTSGPRLGIEHRSGGVFSAIAEILEVRRPSVVLLENVQGLLEHGCGQTFMFILRTLTNLGYSVEWMCLDATWFGIPQTRPRVFIVGTRSSRKKMAGKLRTQSSIFAPLIDRLKIKLVGMSKGALEFRSEGQKLRHKETRIKFGKWGKAEGDQYTTCGYEKPAISIRNDALGNLVAPHFAKPDLVRSVRFYARGKPTKPHFRKEPLSHCLGNVPGGAPDVLGTTNCGYDAGIEK